MKKNDIFTFTAPNGVEVTAIVVGKVGYDVYIRTATTTYLCYAQNRLFTIKEVMKAIRDDLDIKRGTAGAESLSYEYGEIIVEYCFLPDYDNMLERYNDIEVAQAETDAGM
jgi:hypothetical protein